MNLAAALALVCLAASGAVYLIEADWEARRAEAAAASQRIDEILAEAAAAELGAGLRRARFVRSERLAGADADAGPRFSLALGVVDGSERLEPVARYLDDQKIEFAADLELERPPAGGIEGTIPARLRLRPSGLSAEALATLATRLGSVEGQPPLRWRVDGLALVADLHVSWQPTELWRSPGSPPKSIDWTRFADERQAAMEFVARLAAAAPAGAIRQATIPWLRSGAAIALGLSVLLALASVVKTMRQAEDEVPVLRIGLALLVPFLAGLLLWAANAPAYGYVLVVVVFAAQLGTWGRYNRSLAL